LAPTCVLPANYQATPTLELTPESEWVDNTVETQLSELQLSEQTVTWNTKNPLVAHENLDNFLTTPPH